MDNERVDWTEQMRGVLVLGIETTGLDAFADRMICIVAQEGYDPATRQTFAGPEEQMIDEFREFYDEFWTRYQTDLSPCHYNPVTVCTYNGDAFDVPFLVARSARYGLDLRYLAFERFAHHLDLCWIQRRHFKTTTTRHEGKVRNIGLRDLARFVGIECNPDRSDDARWDLRKMREILDHCRADVGIMVEVYQRLYNICELDLADRIDDHRLKVVASSEIRELFKTKKDGGNTNGEPRRASVGSGDTENLPAPGRAGEKGN